MTASSSSPPSSPHASKPSLPPQPPQLETKRIKCQSCGFTEECTPSYISCVRERFHGRWICGLCIEAVKDEMARSGALISTEEALRRHTSFFDRFRSPGEVSEHPISALGRVIRRSLDSPRPLRSSSSGSLYHEEDGVKTASLARSDSCFPALSG